MVKEKPLEDLMKGVKVTNSCKLNDKYAIFGNVKSSAKLVTEKSQLPSTIHNLYCILQHIVLYKITYGKGNLV